METNTDNLNAETRSLEQRILNLIYKANETTGKNDTDLTSGVNSLIEGYASPPWIDSSQMTSFRCFFAGDSNLQFLGHIDTSNGVNFNAMFQGCTQLTTIPMLDVSKGTDFTTMFTGCSQLTEIPELDTRNGTEFTMMFNTCPLLETIANLDIRNGGMMMSIMTPFQSCASLTNLTLKNIPRTLQIGSGNDWGHLLTMDSLLCLLNETMYYTDGEARTLTVGTGNLAKFTGDYEYVKPTGKYLDVDDNEITELAEGCKIPVVWCASTDEGAMTVADYLAYKGWQIA